MGHYDPGYELPVVEAGKPDWIDYRASIGRAERRVEAGEVVSRCWSCKTELDVAAPVHSPRCRTIGRPSDDGRAALDAMDRLETQRELLAVGDQDEDEVDVDGDPEQLEDVPTTDEVPKPEEEVETVPGPAAKWDRESIIRAIRTWALEHGKPPSSREWDQAADDHPAKSTVAKHCGSWADAVVAAGFDRPTRGGSNRSSVREPKARETVKQPPPASVTQPASTGDDAVRDESPSPLVGSETGSRTDEENGHLEWLLSLGLNTEMLVDEIARLDEISVLCATRRDALQRFLDELAVA